MPRSVELLSPARNLECGIEAIRHGADAVYIGAPRFGARAAAGNSLEDLARLVEFAHPFGVRIYVTLNTLLHDDELSAAQALIKELAAIHVDALIVQDPRIGQWANSQIVSPIPLHSSTQMDNRTVEDVRARLTAGYQQTVLARELSLEDIRAIHTAVPEMPLEVFVHGALCVSYSGRCYASEYCFQRSANRGECAQFCRLPFDLVDAAGKVIERQRHLLSLRDMNRAADLEALLDAGASSFKIEGRLKDVGYVKNITAYYRQQLDSILSRRAADYCRSSFGTSTFTFTPSPRKSFNRGFTDYFLHGRTPDMACHATPKSIGEPVGTVKEVQAGSLSVAGTATFANGDGLCFFTPAGQLRGFRVNRVDEGGRLYPAESSVLAELRPRTPLYRNFDQAFERQIARPTADRRIAVRWLVEKSTDPDGFRLTLTDEAHRTVCRTFPLPLEPARSPQSGNICRQLTRLGDTIFSADSSSVEFRLSQNWFIPSSVLAEWRRTMVECLMQKRLVHSETFAAESVLSQQTLSTMPSTDTPLMTCRYCLRHALGACTKGANPQIVKPSSRQVIKSSNRQISDPLFLQLADGRRFPLRFDCKNCQMLVLAPTTRP